MKAAVIDRYGDPEVLIYREFPNPEPGAGEALIKVAAASINPVDLLQRAGETRAYLPVPFPGVIGWDVAGTVIKVGTDVTDFSVGDRVFAWAFATYAELCVVSTAILAKVPAGVDLMAAAALPLVTTTGSQLISVASGVERGQTLLVSGAVGSVARAAVRTAKDMGASVLAGVRSDQIQDAGKIGADAVVALDDDEALRRLDAVDIVANTVRGETADKLLSKVKAGGTYASVTGAPAKAAAFPDVKVIPFVSRQSPDTLAYMAAAVAAGTLSIPVVKSFPLSEARQAHELMHTGVSGKVLLIP